MSNIVYFDATHLLRNKPSSRMSLNQVDTISIKCKIELKHV